MTKKKKIILSTLLGLALIIAGLGYSIWSNNAETKKGIAWIEEQGGDIEYMLPEWIEKCPGFTQKLLKGIVGPKIIAVNLSGTEVTDISLLKNMNDIEFLDLTDTEVTDLSPLKNMTKLRELHLIITKVSDLSPLKNMTMMQRLYLFDIQVSDLSPLKDMALIKRLYLSGNQVNDLSFLKDMIMIQSLDLFNTQVSNEQINELQLKIPTIKITKE